MGSNMIKCHLKISHNILSTRMGDIRNVSDRILYIFGTYSLNKLLLLPVTFSI